MHVDSHVVSLISSHARCHDARRILSQGVAYTSFLLHMTRRRMQFELEGLSCADEKDKAADILPQRSSCGHGSAPSMSISLSKLNREENQPPSRRLRLSVREPMESPCERWAGVNVES